MINEITKIIVAAIKQKWKIDIQAASISSKGKLFIDFGTLFFGEATNLDANPKFKALKDQLQQLDISYKERITPQGGLYHSFALIIAAKDCEKVLKEGLSLSEDDINKFLLLQREEIAKSLKSLKEFSIQVAVDKMLVSHTTPIPVDLLDTMGQVILHDTGFYDRILMQHKNLHVYFLLSIQLAPGRDEDIVNANRLARLLKANGVRAWVRENSVLLINIPSVMPEQCRVPAIKNLLESMFQKSDSELVRAKKNLKELVFAKIKADPLCPQWKIRLDYNQEEDARIIIAVLQKNNIKAFLHDNAGMGSPDHSYSLLIEQPKGPHGSIEDDFIQEFLRIHAEEKQKAQLKQYILQKVEQGHWNNIELSTFDINDCKVLAASLVSAGLKVNLTSDTDHLVMAIDESNLPLEFTDDNEKFSTQVVNSIRVYLKRREKEQAEARQQLELENALLNWLGCNNAAFISDKKQLQLKGNGWLFLAFRENFLRVLKKKGISNIGFGKYDKQDHYLIINKEALAELSTDDVFIRKLQEKIMTINIQNLLKELVQYATFNYTSSISAQAKSVLIKMKGEFARLEASNEVNKQAKMIALFIGGTIFALKQDDWKYSHYKTKHGFELYPYHLIQDVFKTVQKDTSEIDIMYKVGEQALLNLPESFNEGIFKAERMLINNTGRPIPFFPQLKENAAQISLLVKFCIKYAGNLDQAEVKIDELSSVNLELDAVESGTIANGNIPTTNTEINQAQTESSPVKSGTTENGNIPPTNKESEIIQSQSHTDSISFSNISMQVLGGFIAVMGITAIAVAFVALNAATFGLATLGAAALLGGVGLFAVGTYKENTSPSQEELISLNHHS
jgi:hypothetical protein